MEDMLIRTLPIAPITKQDISEDERAIIFTITTPSKDLYDEIVDTKGADLSYFLKHPSFLWAHNQHIPAIGRGMWAKKEKDNIKLKVQFHATTQLAREVYELYKTNYLTGCSIGFKPLTEGKIDKDDIKHWDKWILIETSACNSPANPDAIVVAKSLVSSERLKKELGFETKEKEEENEEKKQTYNCECLDCGHKFKTEKHCKDVKCPKCGGKCRRVERPGPGTKAEEYEKEEKIKKTKEVCPVCGADTEAEDEGTHCTKCDWDDLDVESEKAIIVPIESEKVDIEYVKKPYPNEHACRLRSPDDFKPDSFRRVKRKHDGKEYFVIMGRLKDETTMTEQAYRYPKDIWSAKEAKAHCKEHKGKFEPAQEGKSEDTDDSCPSCDEEIKKTEEELKLDQELNAEIKALELGGSIKTEILKELEVWFDEAISKIKIDTADICAQLEEKINKNEAEINRNAEIMCEVYQKIETLTKRIESSTEEISDEDIKKALQDLHKSLPEIIRRELAYQKGEVID